MFTAADIIRETRILEQMGSADDPRPTLEHLLADDLDDDPPTGRLENVGRTGYGATVADRAAAALTGSFLDEHGVLDDLASYPCDVAVLAYIDEDDRLLTIPCRRHPVAVLVRRDHRFAARDSIRLTEREGEPMIVREQGSTTRRAFEEALAETGTKPRLMMEIGSREAIREAVLHGLGISSVSEAKFVPDENLKLVRIEGAEVYTYAHVVVLKQRESSPVIKAFLGVVHAARDGFDAVADKP